MRKLFTLLLFLPFCLQAQDLAIQRTRFKNTDYSLITVVKWRQLNQSGNSVVTIANPDSLRTKVYGINRAGTYKFELAITFIKSGKTTTARDTVLVLAKPPVKDSVYVIDKMESAKSVMVISVKQSTMKVQVLNGTTVAQNYATPAYSGIRVLWITGLKPESVVRITLNGKVYNL